MINLLLNILVNFIPALIGSFIAAFFIFAAIHRRIRNLQAEVDLLIMHAYAVQNIVKELRAKLAETAKHD